MIGARLKTIWALHGTKVLGFAGSLIGTISLIDSTTVHLIEEFFGPHCGHQVASALMIIGGLATAWRGFQNSQPKS